MKKINLTTAILICSCFFIIGFIWGRYGVSSINNVFKQKSNISQFLDTINIIDFETNNPFNIDLINASNRNVLIFWSTTCDFCEQFFSDFTTLKPTTRLVCFPIDTNIKLLHNYFQEHEIIKPQLLTYNNGGHIVNPFNIRATPTILVTDKKGYIIYSQIGAELSSDFINAIE
jgi:thioredoxin-related protein